MDRFDEIDLQDCPCCGSTGSIEEEGGWCLYVQCGYCGAHTAELSYKNEAERQAKIAEAKAKAAAAKAAAAPDKTEENK